MIVERLFQWRVEEHNKHKREKDIVWVTDLIYCPLKPKYETKYPILSEANCYDPYTMQGLLVHVGLEKLLEEWFNAKTEAEAERSLGNKRIRGRIDALLENSRIGIEIKTAKADSYIPYEHHIEQAKTYNWLSNLDKTILVYVTPERIAEYEITESYSNAEIRNMLSNLKTPKYDWECSYCSYSLICPSKVVKRK